MTQGSGPVPSAYIDHKYTKESVLTLHGSAKALSQLPAMFLKQPVSNVVLVDRTEEKKTKNIPIIRGAFPRGHCPQNNKIKTKTEKQTLRPHISTTTTTTIIIIVSNIIHITYSV